MVGLGHRFDTGLERAFGRDRAIGCAMGSGASSWVSAAAALAGHDTRAQALGDHCRPCRDGWRRCAGQFIGGSADCQLF